MKPIALSLQIPWIFTAFFTILLLILPLDVSVRGRVEPALLSRAPSILTRRTTKQVHSIFSTTYDLLGRCTLLYLWADVIHSSIEKQVGTQECLENVFATASAASAASIFVLQNLIWDQPRRLVKGKIEERFLFWPEIDLFNHTCPGRGVHVKYM